MHRLTQAARLLTLCGLALTASEVAGCGSTGDVSYPQPDFPLVEAETVEVAYDEEDQSRAQMFDALDDALEQGQQPLVGDEARTVKPMREGMFVANNILRVGVQQLRRIHDEGEFLGGDANQGTWRLELDRIFELHVERINPLRQTWAYTVTSWPADAPDGEGVIAIAGYFDFEGREEGTRRQLGTGVFQFNYGAVGARKEAGRGSVAFRSGPRGRALSLFLLDFVPRASSTADPINARYSYLISEEGGLFRFFARGDLIADVEGDEAFQQAVRWNANRAARSHVRIVTTGAPEDPVIEECWGPNVRQTWVISTPEVRDFEGDGDVRSCPFLDRPDLPDPAPVSEDELPEVPAGP